MPSALRPDSWPLAVRTAVDLLCAAVIPLCLAVLLLGVRGLRTVEAAAERNLALAAQGVATQIDQVIRDAQAKLLMVADDERVQRFCAGDDDARATLLEPIGAQLARIRRDDIDVGSVFVTDAVGIGIVSTHAHNIGQDLTFREYWQRGRQGERFISQLLVGTRSREAGIYMSAPVTRGSDTVGVAVLKLDGRRLEQIVRQVRVQSGEAMLSDASGIILVHPDTSVVYRSLGPLDESTRRAIDPVLTFGIDAIEDAGLDTLMAPLRSRSLGSVTFTRTVDGGAPERWVLGHAPLETQPWVASVALPARVLQAPLASMAGAQVSIALVLSLLAALYALFRGPQLARPIVRLTAAARRVADGHLDERVPDERPDEIGCLGAAFNRMIPRLRERIELRQSMSLAGRMQGALLPANDPDFAGLDVCGWSTPCDAAGGDYFDYIDVASTPDGGLVVVGDVMGHGVGAALVMASARGALRAAAADEGDLAAVVGTLNRIIAADSRDGRFMTLLLMHLDPARRVIRWVSAGHDPPLVLEAGTDGVVELDGGGLPLGIVDDAEYAECRVAMPPVGSVMLLGTDGIWEAQNRSGEQFGKERLADLLRRHRDRSARQIATALDATLRGFADGVPFADDVTFVVIRVGDAPSGGDAA